MLCACTRVRGLDPLNASLLPPMSDEVNNYHAGQLLNGHHHDQPACDLLIHENLVVHNVFMNISM